MRCTENEGYYTAESTITWPLDPLIQQPPPLFDLTAAVSWNETFDQPDYPRLTPDYPRLAPNLLQRSIRSLQIPNWAKSRISPALTHTSSLDTDLTRNTRAPHFTPQHWLLCHMGLY